MTEYKDTNVLEEKKKTTRKAKKPKYDSISYLTGDIGLNIDHFNKVMGTYQEQEGNSESSESTPGDATGESTGESGGCCEALTEAKRYVRRYYVRPQNIFCSNKAEVVKTLIDIGDANCSIYTLNNLGDDKDVAKLMNSDIIYYYDDGILYDKNHVRVMDYDLSIKKEENRKHFANVDKVSDKEFRQEYSDRMTDATELEESYNLDEAFNLDFEAYNVFGELLTEAKQQYCCICGEPLEEPGNNPEPYKASSNGQCCDGCYLKFVLPLKNDMTEE